LATITHKVLLDEGLESRFFHGSEEVGLEGEVALPSKGRGLRMRFLTVDPIRGWDPDVLLVFGGGVYAIQVSGLGRRRFLHTATLPLPLSYVGAGVWLLIRVSMLLHRTYLGRKYVILSDTEKVRRYVGGDLLFPSPIHVEGNWGPAPRGDPLILYWGRITPTKGVFEIPKVVSFLRRRLDVRCEMYGIHEVKPGPWIGPCEMHGPLPDQEIPRVVRRASVALFPSVNEAYGIVAGEAALLGVVPVVTCNYGIREYVPSIPCFRSLRVEDIAARVLEVLEMDDRSYSSLISSIRKEISKSGLLLDGFRERILSLLSHTST